MMDNKENLIKQNLEEVFSNLAPKGSAPEHLKKEVFQTLDTLHLIGDIADLFTVKMTKSEATFFDLIAQDFEPKKGETKNK